MLEIGAGTGSLTREVIKVLPADRTEYLFTDIGPAFVTAAKAQFGNYSFVDYKPFDLEKPAAEQGLNLHGYDLILASAVLHATEDLRRTLRNIVSCLAPDGLLVFLEPIHRRNLTDIIFGGLPGWWKFTDTDLRPNHALMERSRWERLLSECGFRSVASALSAPTEDESEQAILMAVVPEINVTKDGSGIPSRNGTHATPNAPTEIAATKPATHLVFADQHGLADHLVEEIEHRGQRAVRVTVGDALRQIGEHRFEMRPTSAEDLRELLSRIDDLASITHGWSLDHPQVEELSLDALEGAQTTGVLHVMRLAQVLSGLEWQTPPRVFLLTRSVQHVLDTDSNQGLSSAPLIGFGRVANSEHDPFRWTVIDLDAKPSQYDPVDLANELLVGDKELEIAYRDGRRYVSRLRRASVSDLRVRTQPAIAGDGTLTPYRLQIDKPGVLTHLSLHETPRTTPGEDQIEVQVAAGGINFRDVMKALGMYPGNPVDLKWFGDDFAGVITRVGRPCDTASGGRPRRRNRSLLLPQLRQHAVAIRLQGTGRHAARRRGNATDRLLDGTVRHSSACADASRGTDPDSCGCRRSRAGRDSARPGYRAGDFRHGRFAGEATIARRPGCASHHEFCAASILPTRSWK